MNVSVIIILRLYKSTGLYLLGKLDNNYCDDTYCLVSKNKK